MFVRFLAVRRTIQKEQKESMMRMNPSSSQISPFWGKYMHQP